MCPENDFFCFRATAFGKTTGSKDRQQHVVRSMLPVSVARGDNAWVSFTDFPAGQEVVPGALAIDNLWAMNDSDRFKLLFAVLASTRTEECEELEEAIDNLEKAYKEKRSLDLQRDVRE